MSGKKLSVVENTLKLLDILQENDFNYRTKDLERELGIGSRQIRAYVATLRAYGIDIKSVSSTGGGYKCPERYYRIPYLITHDELECLEKIKIFFDSNDVLDEKEVFNRLYYKLYSKAEKNFSSKMESIFYKYLEKSKEEDEEQKKCRHIIEQGRDDLRKIEICYIGNYDSQAEQRIIHPYSLVFYKNDYYVEAFCEKAQGHRSFKLKRIKTISLLEEKFEVDKKLFDEIQSESRGIFREKQYVLKAIFNKPFNKYVQEMTIGENQKTEVLTDESTLLTVSLSNWTETITWLHGFSHYVEVLEPKEMRERMISDIEKNISLYRNSGTMSSIPVVK